MYNIQSDSSDEFRVIQSTQIIRDLIAYGMESNLTDVFNDSFDMKDLLYEFSKVKSIFESVMEGKYNKNFEQIFSLYLFLYYEMTIIYFDTDILDVYGYYDELAFCNLARYDDSLVCSIRDGISSYRLLNHSLLIRPYTQNGLNLTSDYRYQIPMYAEIDKDIFFDTFKRALIHGERINNLQLGILETFDLIDYSLILQDFKNQMEQYSLIVVIIAIVLGLVFVVIAVVIIISNVNIMLERLGILNSIKYDIFYEMENIPQIGIPIPKEEIEDLVKKICNGELKESDKIEMNKKKKFYHQYIVILVETKLILGHFLRNVDCEAKESTEKMVSFTREYKLCKFLLTYSK